MMLVLFLLILGLPATIFWTLNRRRIVQVQHEQQEWRTSLPLKDMLDETFG